MAGCTTVEEQKSSFDPDRGQFTLYLNGPDKPSLDITFELLSVAIVTEDGIPRKVSEVSKKINSISASSRQVLLGEIDVPEGTYKKIQLAFKQASIMKKGRSTSLALPYETIEIDIDRVIQKYQNTSLFLIWDSDASIGEGYQFNPVFLVKGQEQELSSLLIYVTNEYSNNVSVINRHSGQIVATIMAGKRPRGITTGMRKDPQRVYVANSLSNSISIINPETHKVENEIPIRLGWEPEDIVVFQSSPDNELIFVANYRSNSVSIIDTITYEEIEKIDVGIGPIALAVDPPAEDLIDSVFLSFQDINTLRTYREKNYNVYVANKNSNTLSVLRINLLDNRLEEVIHIDVEWTPVSIGVDYQRGRVYVANYNSDNLSVINILQLVKGNPSGAVSAIREVGHTVIGVISDPDIERIYLLKENSSEILIIRPYIDRFRATDDFVPIVIGTIPVGNRPRSFILDPEARNLYVVNSGSDTVSVINKTTKKQEKVIPVGRRPYGITVFQGLL
jgi:YVTN family beta-propeller protein